VKLVRPDPRYRESFLSMMAEAGRTVDFDEHLETCRAAERGEVEEGLVPWTTYWLVDGDEVLGSSRLRHRLSDSLWFDGGHVGYDIRASRRGEGLGARQLALVLRQAGWRGMKFVLLTVEETNPASVRVIEKNGGRRIDRLPTGFLRYRIDLAEPVLDLPGPGADPDGIVGIGGLVTAEGVVRGYMNGTFPWPMGDEGTPVWCSPDPRFVLFPDELRVSESLRQRVRSGRFSVRLDTNFDGVISGCTRPEGWITDEMRAAYVEAFAQGHAHCAEAWRDGKLVGGLYGIAIGAIFFGESMFAHEPDASKVAFVTMVEQLKKWGFGLIDCQQETAHLARFGARAIPRHEFLDHVAELTTRPDAPTPWRLDTEPESFVRP
jgi:leucyl/phenylalanyl-tRNA--protein transferase